MDHKKKLQKYYLYGLVPALAVWVLISFSLDHVYGVFFMLGYIWPYMYHTPGFDERALSRNYRFSFLGNLFRFQQQIFSMVPEGKAAFLKPLARLVIPFLITGLLSIINPTWSPLWNILGWASFEGFNYLNRKFKWDLM